MKNFGSTKDPFKTSTKKYLKILKSLDLKPKVKLGQHFLADDEIAAEQIHFAKITKSDTVLEIGPGLGILTNKLSKLASKVIAIELDSVLYSYLIETMPGNVEIINGDALKLDFPKFNKLVSNIPYQISSPLIFKLINYKFDLAVIMLQLEFARRLIASPNSKEYSRLTVMSSYYYDTELLREVSMTRFVPVPRVGSAIIQMVPKKKMTTPTSEPLFFEFVKIVFSERRKMIRNSILSHFSKFSVSRTELKEIISCLPNITSRPEQLSLEELITLSNELHLALLKSNSATKINNYLH